MKIEFREYMAHKATYDTTHYAKPIKGDPAHVSLCLRTRHAGNQPGSRQCDYLAFISRRASEIVHSDAYSDLCHRYREEFRSYQDRRRRARKDPDKYRIGHRDYSCSTITLYIRCRLREQIPFDRFKNHKTELA